MKLLQSLLEATKASDINVYYGHVKRQLKKDPKFAKGKITRGAIASVVHAIAEDDPDSNIDTGAIIAGVYAKYKKQFTKAAPVAEGFQGGPAEKSPLSSKDRSFKPGAAGIGGDDEDEDFGSDDKFPSKENDFGDDMGPEDDAEGGDDEVQELKDLRTKDIGDKLTPEQQKELAELRADQGGSGEFDDDADDECSDENCMDKDCSTHGQAASSDSPGISTMRESAKPLLGKVKEALKRREAKGAEKAEEEEEEVPPKKKTVGRDLDESAKAARAKRLAEMNVSILAGITKKSGSFLK